MALKHYQVIIYPVLNKANKFELEDLATRVLQLHNLDNLTNNFIPKIMLQ